MALSSSAVSHHVRSNSWPSATHPIASQAEEQLCRLRSSGSTSTSTSLSHKLNGLQDLHECIDRLLLLPQTRQAIGQGSADGLLDGSLRLLDACNVIKDVLSQTRESSQEIQSVMRRRCEDQTEAKKFLSTRKIVRKSIHQALKNLRETNNIYSSDDQTVAILGEAQTCTLRVFETLLSFINGKKSTSWSLVSKLMRPNQVGSKEEEGENEFSVADAAVQSLISHKESAENVQNKLQKLVSCIQDFEDCIETLFRRVIKTRVSLLNILNH